MTTLRLVFKCKRCGREHIGESSTEEIEGGGIDFRQRVPESVTTLPNERGDGYEFVCTPPCVLGAAPA